MIRALLTLARGIDRGEVDVERLAWVSDEEAATRLRELRGVGRWTAEYVLLRGLGRLRVFPGDDVGAQKSLARWLGRRGPLDYDGVNSALEKWRPCAGMIYFHLLLDGLAQAGSLGSPEKEPGSCRWCEPGPYVHGRRGTAQSRHTD